LIFSAVLSTSAKGWLAFATGLAALAGVAAAWWRVYSGHALDVTFGRWDGPIQLAYHVDSLSLLFALMSAGIGAAVLLYSIGYMKSEKGTTRFYSLMLLFIAGMINLVYTADLFLLYSAGVHRTLLIFLVGFWYRQTEAALWRPQGADDDPPCWLWPVRLSGAAVPSDGHDTVDGPAGRRGVLHGHLRAGAHRGAGEVGPVSALYLDSRRPWPRPTPVSALLHAACYVKAGVYLIARLHTITPWPVSWA